MSQQDEPRQEAGGTLRALYCAEWDGKRLVLTAMEDELRETAEGIAEEASGSRGKRRVLLNRLADRIEKAVS